MQIIVNIILTMMIYLLIAYSFSIIYATTKFFHIAHAITITMAAYFTYYFSKNLFVPLYLAMILSAIFSTFFGVLSHIFIYKPLREKNATSMVLLMVSLGLYIIFQNIISLICGDSTKSFRLEKIIAGHELWDASITNIQIITVLLVGIIISGGVYFHKYSKIGRNIRAVSSNSELSDILGINSNAIILWAFGIGSFLAAIAGILVACDTDMVPSMGFNLLLYGVVAMIIGGIGSVWGLVGGSFLLAAAQHISSYYIGSQWMDAIAYIILIIFLLCKPLGISGKRLKKIEI